MTAAESVTGRLTGFSPERPILLVTDYPADTPGGGAVILRSLLDGQDRERVVWASPTPADDPVLPGAATLGAARPGVAAVGRCSSTARSTPERSREVAELARRLSARAVWMVMHGAVVPIAARLTRPGALGLPVHLTVHDDPAFASAEIEAIPGPRSPDRTRLRREPATGRLG